MIKIRRNDVERECAVCGRTLLLGERLVSYRRPQGDDAPVCELCLDEADSRGWIREGAPVVPLQLWAARSAACAASWRPAAASGARPSREATSLPETRARRSPPSIELFNESVHPRTVSGITRTLGEPRVSIVLRSPREVVVTVAWDLSWYQFRVDMLGAQPVTLQHRGEELDEIDTRFRDWNAHAEADGRLALAVADHRSNESMRGKLPTARGRRRSRTTRRSSGAPARRRRRSASPPLRRSTITSTPGLSR